MKQRKMKRLFAAVLSAMMVSSMVIPSAPASETEAAEGTVYTMTIDDSARTWSNELFKIQYEPSEHWYAESGYPDLFYDGTDYYSISGEEGTGDYYTMRFIGTGIELHGSINTAHANCDVYIDDVKVGEMHSNQESGSTVHKQKLFEKTDLPDGEHVLKVVKQAETNTKAMQLDSVTVYHGELPKVEILDAYVGSVDEQTTQEDYDSLVLEAVQNTSWEDIAWRGDELVSKIVTLSGDETVHNVKLAASDFSDENGTISSEYVEIRWLKDVNANIGRGNPSAPAKAFPDVIYKNGATDIEPNTVQSAWISITIPEDAKPGIYKGTITLTADELETYQIFSYQFEVLDLLQPGAAETGTQIQVWQHPFSVANYYGVAEEDYFTEEHFKYMRASMKEYESMGGHDVVANIVEEAWNHQSYYSDPSMVKWTKKADGTMEFDYTWYDAWINFQISCGVLNPEEGIGQIKCYSIVPWNNQVAWYDEASAQTVTRSYTPGSTEWTEIWTIFLNDFLEHSEEKGWFDMTYISMDERSLEQLNPAVALIESVTNSEGKHFKISSALNYAAPEYYDFTDRIDDISINQGNITDVAQMQALTSHRKALGLTTTLYTCTGDYPSNFTISEPEDNMWVMWYSMSLGMDGYMRWAWDNWVEDPLTDVTYKYWEPGDGWFIYPVEKDSSENSDYFYSTPRYEMMKKGIRDINKAKYLMSCSQELSDKVDALVKSLERPAKGNNGYGSAVPATEEDRLLAISEANRMRTQILELSKEYLEAQKPGPDPDPDPDPDPNPDPENPELPFTDVANDDWFYNYVCDVYIKNLMTGLGETVFGPSENLARAQFAVILYRMEGSPATKYEDTFPDVPGETWYTDAVSWAAGTGIVTGYTDTGMFGPSDKITREQMAVMMYRYAKYKKYDVSAEKGLDDFPDAGKVSVFAKDAMKWCTDRGIITGDGQTRMLLPQGNTNRAVCATIISRYIGCTEASESAGEEK